jgi:hypothetical protein
LLAAGGKTLAAQNRPSGLRLEGDVVGFPALIANDFVPFALASSATLSRPAEVLAARVATGLTALGMGESALAIIILLSFSKRKGASTLCASDFQVWHELLRGFIWLTLRQSVLSPARTVQRILQGLGRL